MLSITSFQILSRAKTRDVTFWASCPRSIILILASISRFARIYYSFTQTFSTMIFHLASVLELARIAREVRIFPLIDISVKRSRHVEPIIRELERDGYSVELKVVSYELMRGANELMMISKRG